jgi:hypothetical protein
MHESDAPDILAFLQAAEKWMGDELELSRLEAKPIRRHRSRPSNWSRRPRQATARRRPLLKEIGIESQPRR